MEGDQGNGECGRRVRGVELGADQLGVQREWNDGGDVRQVDAAHRIGEDEASSFEDLEQRTPVPPISTTKSSTRRVETPST